MVPWPTLFLPWAIVARAMSGQPLFWWNFMDACHTQWAGLQIIRMAALLRGRKMPTRASYLIFFGNGTQAWMLGRLDCFIALNVLNSHSTCFVLEKKKLRFLAFHFQVSAKQQPVPDIQTSLQRPAQFKEAVSATHAWGKKFPSSNSCTQFNLKADLFIGCLAARRTQQREDIKPCLFL